MAAVSALRSALATNVDTVTGLRVFARVPMQPSPPMAIVLFNGYAAPRRAMAKGLTEMEFLVEVYTADASQEGAGEAAMDPYVATSGAGSMWVAIESDRTLGGNAEELQVTEMSGYEFVEFGNQLLTRCTWTVQVFADASA